MKVIWGLLMIYAPISGQLLKASTGTDCLPSPEVVSPGRHNEHSLPFPPCTTNYIFNYCSSALIQDQYTWCTWNDSILSDLVKTISPVKHFDICKPIWPLILRPSTCMLQCRSVELRTIKIVTSECLHTFALLIIVMIAMHNTTIMWWGKHIATIN